MQNVHGALQLILYRRLDRAQGFRSEDEGSHDRSAKGLRHSEPLNAVIEGDREFLRQ